MVEGMACAYTFEPKPNCSGEKISLTWTLDRQKRLKLVITVLSYQNSLKPDLFGRSEVSFAFLQSYSFLSNHVKPEHCPKENVVHESTKKHDGGDLTFPFIALYGHIRKVH